MYLRNASRSVLVAALVLAAASNVAPLAQAISLEFLAQWGGPANAVCVVGTTAYVGLGHRLVVLDLTNPSTPLYLGESDSIPEQVRAVTVSGSYAYLAGFWAGGLAVVDISDPAAPLVVGSLPWIGPATDVAVAGEYAFVAVGDMGLAVVNVAFPEAPFLETTYDTPGDAQGIVLAGTRAYIADGAGGLQIVDISDPLNPAYAGSCATTGAARGLFVSGATVYVAADFDGGLNVVDVADPGSPALVGSCSTGAAALAVTVAGDFAYVANAWAGLAVVNVSDPAAPAHVGQCETSGWARGVSLGGTVACVADEAGGVQIVDVSAPPAAVLVGEYRRVCGEVTDVAAVAGLAFMSHGGAGGGVLAMDLTNPADPQPLSNAPSYEFAWGLTYADPYILFADGCAGLGVVDAADPMNLQRIGLAPTGCAARDVVVQGDFAYVADDHQGLLIVDISEPTAPVLRGAWQDPVNPGYPLGVAVSGDHAFLVGADAGLHVINIANPVNPVGVAWYDTAGYAFDVALTGGYALVADDWAGLVILDISDPADPAWVGQCAACAPAHGVVTLGIYALVAAHQQGVLVVDILDPANPTIVASYDTGGFARRVAVSGNLVLVADEAGGLVVLSLADTADYAWVNPLGGHFAMPSNWDPHGPPGPTSRAIFDLPESYTVTFPAGIDVTNDRLLVNGGDVTFDLSGRTYTLARSTEASQVVASNTAATLRVRNGVLQNRGQLFVGEQPAGVGQLVIDGWGDSSSVLISEHQLIVGLDGASGSVDVVGPDAELHVTGRHPSYADDLISVELGRGGFGAMSILEGGYVHVPYGGAVQTGYMSVGGGFGQGALTIDSAGSALEIDCMLEVGRDGGGSVWVHNGGQLRMVGMPPDGGYTFIGMRAPGEVHVSGAGSRFTLSGELCVGQAHSGSLDVNDGGVVDSGDGTLIVGDLNYTSTEGAVTVVGNDSALYAGLTRIGNERPGHVTVSDGAFMETRRQIQLGYNGFGTLIVAAGGEVISHKSTSPTASSGLIGAQASAHGRAWVTGPGSQWTQDGALTVGWGGIGEVSIADGGFVQSVDGIIGRLVGADGVVTVADPNSAWLVTGDLTIGGLPAGAGGDASLTVSNGASVVVGGRLLAWPGGHVHLQGGSINLGAAGAEISGQLAGWGSVAGSVSILGGATMPGAPLGRIEIDGDFAQDAASTLTMEIGGLTPGSEYDQLAVTGAATLAGMLQVEIAGDFEPVVGDRFYIVTAGSVLDLSEKVVPLVPGIRLVVLTTATDVSVAATWPADSDGDLDVDIDDFVAFGACMKGPDISPGTGCAFFDSDADGDVDMADVLSFQTTFTGPR